MKPTFRIEANGSDVTAAIRARLSNLSLVDADGEKSDSLTIELSDSPDLVVPEVGAELRAWIGFANAPLIPMGLFSLDKIELKSPPPKMVLSAAGVPWTKTSTFKSMASKKARSWEAGTTLGIILKTIAEEYGLEPVAKEELLGLVFPHEDQTDESDISFLRRITKKFDITVKPTTGKLAVFSKKDTNALKGEPLEAVTLSRGELSSWGTSIEERIKYTKVSGYWNDAAAAQSVPVEAGEGDAVYIIREPYADAESAVAGVNAKLAGFARKGRTAQISMPGRGGIFAGTPITIEGVRSQIDGAWRTVKVTHRIGSGGWTIQADLEAAL